MLRRVCGEMVTIIRNQRQKKHMLCHRKRLLRRKSEECGERKNMRCVPKPDGDEVAEMPGCAEAWKSNRIWAWRQGLELMALRLSHNPTRLPFDPPSFSPFSHSLLLRWPTLLRSTTTTTIPSQFTSTATTSTSKSSAFAFSLQLD